MDTALHETAQPSGCYTCDESADLSHTGVIVAYCSSCGNQVPQGARFCGGCGNRLTADREATQPAVLPGPAGNRRQRGGRRGVVAAVVVVVAVVAVAGAVAAYTVTRSPGHRHTAASPAARTPSPKLTRSKTTPSPKLTRSKTTPPPPSFAQLYQRDHTGVVRIDVTSCDGGGTGTGFLVAPDLVVTAEHVVNGAVSVGLTAGGTTRAGDVVGHDAAHDVALVRASSPFDGHLFTMSTSQPQVGTQIGVIGYPEGGPISFSTGIVSGLDRTINIEGKARQGLVQTDAALNPGNSGGPMMLIDGTVLGFVDAARTDAAGISYGVPSTVAEPLVAQWQQAPRAVAASHCANATGPNTTTVAVGASSPDAKAIAAMFGTYFNAIDGADFPTAYAQLDDHQHASLSEAQFAANVSSSYDFAVNILSVTQVAPGTDVAAVDFTSLQSSDQGPNGDKCDDWTLAYTLKSVGGSWLIHGAAPLNGSTHTSCGD